MNLNWTPPGRERLNAATSAMMDLIEEQGVRSGDPAWIDRRRRRLEGAQAPGKKGARVDLQPTEVEVTK